jgi:hypothetical protein
VLRATNALKSYSSPADEEIRSKMEPEPHQHSVRRIVLPSGRKIDVIRFPERSGRKQTGLHVCPECQSPLVQPVSWTEAGAGQWQLDLHCPNCDWEGDGVYTQQQIERFEDTLENGVQSILADLKRLTYANMTAEIERFSQALQADLIVPEDF